MNVTISSSCCKVLLVSTCLCSHLDKLACRDENYSLHLRYYNAIKLSTFYLANKLNTF